MKNRFLFLAAALFAAMTFAACEPTDSGDGKSGKMIDTITSEDEGTFTLDYDGKGRIVKLYAYGTEIDYEYSSGAVVIDTDGYGITATLTGGKITALIGEGPGNYTYTYNGNRLANFLDVDHLYTATWAGGNLTQVVEDGPADPETGVSHNVYTDVYEYSSHANDANLDLNNCPFPMSGIYGSSDMFLSWVGLFGERSKNLVKKRTQSVQYPDEEPYVREVYEYAYTLDKDGYVTKIVSTWIWYEPDGSLDRQGSDTINITYK